MERVRWSRAIAEMKADGKTWKQVAAHTGFSIRKCQRLAAQLKETGDPAQAGAWSIVMRHYDTIEIVMEKAWAAYEAAPGGSSAQVGALRVVLDASEKLLDVAARVGLVPRQLGALPAERRLQEMMRSFIDAAREHDVPTEFLRVLERLSEASLTRPSTVEGRVLPPAA